MLEIGVLGRRAGEARGRVVNSIGVGDILVVVVVVVEVEAMVGG